MGLALGTEGAGAEGIAGALPGIGGALEFGTFGMLGAPPEGNGGA